MHNHGSAVLLTCVGLAAMALPCRAEEPWRPAAGALMTRWAGDVSPESPLPEYPRPQMVRREWQSLNGLWDYAVTPRSAEQRPAAWEGKVLVPFCIESALSGVRRPLRPEERLWYRREFTVPPDWAGRRVLLHFGAVDWEAEVFVNGRSLGRHLGGYDAFGFDITGVLRKAGAQEIAVSVWDPTDSRWQLRGKQALRPAGCSYTACSGIWQTVWLEPVGASRIESLRIVPDRGLKAVRLTVNARTPPEPMSVEVTVSTGKTVVATARAAIGGELTPTVRRNLVEFYKATSAWVTADLDVRMDNARPWSPADPFLYDLTVTLQDAAGATLDSVQSYFGMRSIAVGRDANGNVRPLLNGEPILLPGALDQGYWPDGIYTAATDEALRFDVEAARRLGLVAVRKHVKTEPQRWYTWCDRLGLLVFQDLPSGNEGDPRTDMPASPEAAGQCQIEKGRLIGQLANHPSIVCWVLFNEGWGQHDTLRHVQWARALDPTRLIDEASGFPWHGGGDVVDTHGGIPPRDPRRIGITSEDGGYGLAPAGHCWSPNSWTYMTFDPNTGATVPGLLPGGRRRMLPPLDAAGRNWTTRRVRSLFRSLHEDAGISPRSGVFYCQLTDVEDECNGLLSYDRAVWKVDPESVARAARGEGLGEHAVGLVPFATMRQTTWRFTTARPLDAWLAPDFDDSAWKQGPAGFGMPMAGARVGTEWRTAEIWLRKEFTLQARPIDPLLYVFHDEDVEVYLNGVEACRDSGFLTAYGEFDLSPNAAATLKPGRNVIAVHCRQTAGGQFIDVGLLDRRPPAAAADAHAFAWSNPLPFRYAEGQAEPRTEVRDPCIVREGDTYYLVFTMWPFRGREERLLKEPDQGGSPGIAMYASRDLKDWRFDRWLVRSSELPESCPYKNRFWAPEIHKIGGKFYLIFTADNWLRKEHNPAGTWGTAGHAFVGVADRVTGPYEHITYVDGGTCDMTLFGDDDGQVYAVKPKRDVYLQKIDLTGLAGGKVRLVGPERRVVACSNDDIAAPTSPEYLEGPWMVKIGGRYYLFYAEIYKDRRFPALLGYRTNAAYADRIEGPYRKDPRGWVFFGGHLAAFDGPDGRKWLSYRWEKDDRARGHLCIDPLDLDAQGRVQATETLTR